MRNDREQFLASERRVLIWRRNLLPGSETFIRNQVDSLTAWTAVVAGYRRIDSGLCRTSDIILRSKPLPVLLRVADRMLRVRALPKIVGDAPDLVHAHFLHDALDVLPLCRRHGIPLVVTAHGFDVNVWAIAQDAHVWLRPIIRIGRRHRLKKLFAYASSVIAVSNFLATKLVDIGVSPGAIRVSYIGTALNQLNRSTESVQSQGIIFVGRLQEFKGPGDLLLAVSQLPEDIRSVPVHIVGEGPQRPHLEELARALQLNVSFTGHLPPERVSAAYGNATIFCGPSKTNSAGVAESLGLVFLEAAAAGLPVVAYSVGGVPEAVVDGETGLLVREADIGALSLALERLLRDSSLAESLGSQGRHFVAQRFDIAACTAILEDVYEEAIVSRAFESKD